jgi:hypothetical protein
MLLVRELCVSMPKASLLGDGSCKGWINEASMAVRQVRDSSVRLQRVVEGGVGGLWKSVDFGDSDRYWVDGRMLVGVLTSHLLRWTI